MAGDSELYHIQYFNDTSGTAEIINPPSQAAIVGNPSLVVNSNGLLELFYRDAEGNCWHSYQISSDGGSEGVQTFVWSTAERFDTNIYEDPVFGMNSDDKTLYAFLLQNSKLRYRKQGILWGWNPWTEIENDYDGIGSPSALQIDGKAIGGNSITSK